jgi:hypothetical protein
MQEVLFENTPNKFYRLEDLIDFVKKFIKIRKINCRALFDCTQYGKSMTLEFPDGWKTNTINMWFVFRSNLLTQATINAYEDHKYIHVANSFFYIKEKMTANSSTLKLFMTAFLEGLNKLGVVTSDLSVDFIEKIFIGTYEDKKPKISYYKFSISKQKRLTKKSVYLEV